MFALLMLLWFFGDPQRAAQPRPQPARPQPPADTYLRQHAHSSGHPEQAGRHRDHRRNDRARPACRRGAESCGALHHAGARQGTYDGTIFHRVIANGIIQGGDPLSKDPAQSARYGTGGMRELRFEANREPMTRGAVAAVLAPNLPDSGGSQFFICISDQAALNGQYTVFARVAEGLNVAQKISQGGGRQHDSEAAHRHHEGDDPRQAGGGAPEPFTTETIEDLSHYRAVLETSFGNITFQFLPDKAPNHVRNFLRLASVGVLRRHRVSPGGEGIRHPGRIPADAAASRCDITQERYVRKMPPEFNDTPHDKGIVSLAHGDDPASGDRSFFIVLGRTPALDGKYTAFGRVVGGHGRRREDRGCPSMARRR